MIEINYEFPEKSDFGCDIETVSLSYLAEIILKDIIDEIYKPIDKRINLPGLRLALIRLLEVENNKDFR